MLAWFLTTELLIILGGIAAALIVGPDRAQREREHQQELADIDAFLAAIRKTRERTK